jgi:small-conductance mechanosensitive channel
MLGRLIIPLIFCSQMWAQEGSVPVVIDGMEVARIYASNGPFSAKERAAAIERQILTLAERGFSGKLTTRRVPSEKATAIVAGPFLLMNVIEADAELAGVPRDELAQQYAATIQKAMAGYPARHSWSTFLVALGKTALVWTLFCVSFWLLMKGLAWLSRLLERWVQHVIGATGVRGIHLLLWERSRVTVMAILRTAVGIALLFEFSFLLSYTFGLYPQTAGISNTLLDNLGAGLAKVGLAILHYLPSGGFVIVVVFVVRYLLRGLRFLAGAVEGGELPIKGMHPEMAAPTFQLVRVVVIIFALVVAFPYLPGGQSEAFKGISIFVGLLLSLGGSSAVSNILAGLVLTYMRPFRTGDRVKIADTVGDVLEKNLLVTRLRTIKNVEVVLPNGAILSTQILNYSALARSQGLILHTTITIGYDAPWRTVHELLIRAALQTEGVLPEPRPFVLQTSLNDFHISYELNTYTDRPNDIQDIYSHLHQAIQDSFNQGGVEIMSPTFYALRDGNTVTIPAEHRPPDYEVPSFRVQTQPTPVPAAPDGVAASTASRG